MTAPLGVRLDAIEATLCALVSPVVPAPAPGARRGRLAILPATWLWTGLLVCLLRGDRSFRAIWQRLTVGGMRDLGRIEITADAICNQRYRGSGSVMEQLFRDTTAVLAGQPALGTGLRGYAQVIALDGSTPDAMARRLPWLLELRTGAAVLLPGARAVRTAPIIVRSDFISTDGPCACSPAGAGRRRPRPANRCPRIPAGTSRSRWHCVRHRRPVIRAATTTAPPRVPVNVPPAAPSPASPRGRVPRRYAQGGIRPRARSDRPNH